ncbi:AhpC/TSA antioxidant enzyme [Nitzschia inconspicua]|uniref:AhpC/TSA antioxidant enzyme n=1 Tax=Nitzschia inconspicua TaxID=303405 RepID=A0A9K3KMY6_9STRA|nr:AhpC/TSA antioxidant enzyme [Nitzschia inconspicua]
MVFPRCLPASILIGSIVVMAGFLPTYAFVGPLQKSSRKSLAFNDFTQKNEWTCSNQVSFQRNRKAAGKIVTQVRAHASTTTPDVVSVLSSTNVLDPKTGRSTKALDTSAWKNNLLLPRLSLTARPSKKILVVVMPQMGDFDSTEYAEQLCAVMSDLKQANVELRLIGIGNVETAKLFSAHTGMPLENILLDPTATLHERLNLHRGPNWDVPAWIPNIVLEWFATDICNNNNPNVPSTLVARAWLNYMAMCAGIAAPGTLAEILRGYLGDKSAPERLRYGEKVEAGPIVITGVTDVKLGPIEYQSLWKDQEGFLRPAELATVRLRSMVEVLSKFDQYVPDQGLLDWRGATFLLDAENNYNLLYEYRNRGVLTYSETMDRPLSFLSGCIPDNRAKNPFGLNDPMKPAGSYN